jgi:hypothetical protein
MPTIDERDCVGYGEHTPNPKWPNGAKLAVSFVVNYEEVRLSVASHFREEKTLS